jgi:hypothetical protein
MKTRKFVLLFATTAALTSVIAAVSAQADEDIGKQEKEQVIVLSDMPQPVQDTIRKESEGFELGELMVVTTDRGVFYEADWRVGEDEVSILMTSDGKIIDREREKADDDEDGEENEDGEEDDD